MKLTNDLLLPGPICDAIRNDSYNAGKCDYSVTTLPKPPRIVALSRRHSDEMVDDVSNRIFSLVGQAIHTILERAASDRYIVEKRFFGTFGDKVIAGQVDIYDKETQILSDYKVCSRYVVADGIKPEWQSQASVNRVLLERNGIQVKGAQVVAILRDWSKMQAERGGDYPQRQIAVLPVKLWSIPETEQWVSNRIALHEAAKEQLPECTNEDRWQDPPKWALMKRGAKRAIKLHLTEEQAEDHRMAQDEPKKHAVEFRESEPKRCLYFCSCLPFCSQGRELIQSMKP